MASKLRVRRPLLERNPCSGRVPAWLPLGLALSGFLWVVVQLGRDAHGRGVATIDATCYRLHSGGSWVSEAWRGRIERVLLRAGELRADDREAIAHLRAELEELSFVVETGPAEVIWPDGLSVPLRLREPIACIRVGEDFLPVAEDGTVLAGYSYAPHEAHGGWLPVLGPHGLVYESMEPLQPGDVLTDPRHLDALATARSLRRHLPVMDRQALGRTVIDASRKFGPWGKPGGVRIDLEGARRILYGRAPGGDFPGELPERMKWANVSEGLARLAGGEGWELLDARWDRPDMHARSAAARGEE